MNSATIESSQLVLRMMIEGITTFQVRCKRSDAFSEKIGVSLRFVLQDMVIRLHSIHPRN